LINNSYLKTTFKILVEDVEKAIEEGKKKASPYIRRTYLRAFFALVEGLNYQLKQICLQFCKYNTNLFTFKELSLLHESSYSINDNNSITSHAKFLPILKNLPFTVKCYAKAHNSNFSLLVNKDGWYSFRYAVKIRNRITHPKNPDNLTITDDDLIKIGEATAWFRDNITALLESCSNFMK